GIAPEMDHRAMVILPRQVDQSRMVSGGGGDLGSHAVMTLHRLLDERRRELIDEPDHLVPGHAIPVIDDAQLVDAFQLVVRPVNLPDELALAILGAADRLDGVLGELPEELERVAILAQSVEEEADVADGERQRFLAALREDIRHSWSPITVGWVWATPW